MMKFHLILLFVLIVPFSPLYSQRTYTNPILAGFYPDPSICRAGDDYYIVNSSFAYFPGLPLFHSKDLVTWKQIGHAMDRPEQLDLIGAGVSRGLFAPAITYYKNTFYIVCTLIDRGGNFVITAKDPSGPWSNPVWLKEVNGIDPSLFFDEQTDKAYILYNSNPPENKPLWDGHRTIRMYGFDYNNLKVTGEEKLLVNGGVDVSKKPVWIEAPHLYGINGWYYLMCAEGGTGYNHSEVIFRSKSVEGPFTPWEGNPILTQRDLNRSRKSPITTAGHADLVQTQNGTWYAVFLGCRPYEGDFYNIGRETFMAPVRWTSDGWPLITKGEELKYRYPLPLPNINRKPVNLFTGNFVYKDDFSDSVLDHRYTFLRTVTERWYNTSEKKGKLCIRLRPEMVSGRSNPSFVGFRQQHHRAVATTRLEFTPAGENEKAGLVIFQGEKNFYFLCKSVSEGKAVVQLYQSAAHDSMTLLSVNSINLVNQDVHLRVEPKNDVYTMSFSTDGKNWTKLKDVDGKFLSTARAGGFVGCVLGLYATSSGKPSNSKACFDWFEYKGNDPVFQ